MKKEEIFKKVKKIIAAHMGIENEEEIKESSLLEEELGLDSLDAVEIIMALEDEFNIAIEDEEVEDVKTVGNIVEVIALAVA